MDFHLHAPDADGSVADPAVAFGPVVGRLHPGDAGRGHGVEIDQNLESGRELEIVLAQKFRPGGPGGNDPGVDYYETEISLDELVDIMFEDLELPDMERKILKEALADLTLENRLLKKSMIGDGGDDE